MDIEQTWAKYGQQLRKFITARVPDTGAAEDLTQELLIKSHKNLSSLRDNSQVGPWLFRIARNVVNDYYRKHSRDKIYSIQEIEKLIDSIGHEPSESSAYDDLSKCVQPFIQQLPEKYREIIIAVDIEGESQKKLAEETGISYSTIKSKTQRARAKLRNLLERCCDFELDNNGRIYGFESRVGKCDPNCICDD